MIRDNLAKLGRWIETKSAVGRLVVLVGAVVLFVVAQQFAAISNAAARGTPTMIIAGLVGIVLAVVAIYAAYAVLRSFVRRGRGDEANA